MRLGRLFAWLRRPRREAIIETRRFSRLDSGQPPAHPKSSFDFDPLAESARLYPPVPPSALPPLEPLVPVAAVAPAIAEAPPPTNAPSRLDIWQSPQELELEVATGPAEVPQRTPEIPPLREADYPSAPQPAPASSSGADLRGRGSGLLKIVLADGSVAAPPMDADLERRVAYFAREILPLDPETEAAIAGPGQLKVVLEDGSVVTPEDPDLQRQIEYLANEILSPADKRQRPI